MLNPTKPPNLLKIMAYYFNLPIFDDLTPAQQLVVNETNPIAVSGGPGTGKTVVNLWRHIYNHESGVRKSLLLTYTKTLEHYLRVTAGTKNSSASTHVNRTFNWTYGGNKTFYDEIIIDEAQDVSLDRYQVVRNYCNNCSYGADEAQTLYPQNSTSIKELRNIFPGNEEYELDKNFRNSREILQFTKAVFPNIYIPQQVISGSKETGIFPMELNVGWDFDDFIEKMVEIINEFTSGTHNIGVLTPSANEVNTIYDSLSKNFTCSKYESEMEALADISNIHVTTLKSAKGLEFDTVIILNFDSHKWYINNSKTHTSENDYYVALTRAKTNLYLLTKNKLRGINSTTYEIS